MRMVLLVTAVALAVALAVAVLAVVAGSQYNVVERANLPRLPIGAETLTTGGAIASVGQRLLDTTAKMVIKKFFEKFNEAVAEGA